MAKPRIRSNPAPKQGNSTSNPAILKALRNLLRWAILHGVENSPGEAWLRRQAANDLVLAAASALVGAHVHGPASPCNEHPCRKAAVCLALEELLQGHVAPIGAPILATAQALFEAAGALKDVSTKLEPRLVSAADKLHEELVRLDGERRAMRRRATRQLKRQGTPVPRLKRGPQSTLGLPHAHALLCVAPHEAARQLRWLTFRIGQLEQAIRDTLKNPVDRAPRTGGRRFESPIMCATWHLHAGSFSAREIADVLEEAGDEAERIKRVRDRVSRVRRHVERTGTTPCTVYAEPHLPGPPVAKGKTTRGE